MKNTSLDAELKKKRIWVAKEGRYIVAPKSYREFVAALFEQYALACVPEKKHHSESPTNIAYRDGWNDCIDDTINNIEGAK